MIDPKFADAARLPTMDDLISLTHHDVMVRAAWNTYIKAGASMEQALIGIIVELAKWREGIVNAEVRRMERSPGPVGVKGGG